jgi:glycosyltransferase involved in cell wall biosynthesis
MLLTTSKKINLLYITTGLSIGGAEKMLFNLLAKIDRDRFQPSVISLIDRGFFGDRLEALNIPVYAIGMEPGKPTPDALWRLRQKFKAIRPDLVQGWMYHGNLAAQLGASTNVSQVPIIWSIHHSIASLQAEKITTQLIIKLGAFSGKYTSKIAFVSQKSQSQHEAIGYPADKSCVIPNGFDLTSFQPSVAAKQSVRQELNLPEDCFLIGKFARYHPMKDHANFLKAAALLLKDFPEVRFLMAGTDIDDGNTNLTQLIENLKIGDRVYLLGERQDMPRLTAALNLATSASAYGEAFPLIIGEAMSCGVPCIVTDIGDSAWIVGETGRIVLPQNESALAEAWKELIVLNEEQKSILATAARNRIMASFSLEAVVNQYEQLYRSSLSSKGVNIGA